MIHSLIMFQRYNHYSLWVLNLNKTIIISTIDEDVVRGHYSCPTETSSTAPPPLPSRKADYWSAGGVGPLKYHGHSDQRRSLGFNVTLFMRVFVMKLAIKALLSCL